MASGRSNTWYEITMKHLHGIELHGMKINDVIKLNGKVKDTIRIACAASVSSRGLSRKLGQERKKKKRMTGEEEGKEGTACPQTP